MADGYRSQSVIAMISFGDTSRCGREGQPGRYKGVDVNYIDASALSPTTRTSDIFNVQI